MVLRQATHETDSFLGLNPVLLRSWATTELIAALEREDEAMLQTTSHILLFLATKNAPVIQVHLPTQLEVQMWETLGLNKL